MPLETAPPLVWPLSEDPVTVKSGEPDSSALARLAATLSYVTLIADALPLIAAIGSAMAAAINNSVNFEFCMFASRLFF